jgi:hypothetical protein
MKTLIVRIGDATAAEKHGGHFGQITQTNSGAILPGRGAKMAQDERHGQEAWRQRMEEDWQRHFERLQQYVCDLLLKNQQLRMALMAADERERVYRKSVNL